LSHAEEEVYTEVNGHRARTGLPPLTHSPALSAAARAHSEAMASGSVPLGHHAFRRRAVSVARAVPARSVAENVGAFAPRGQSSGAYALRRWLRSPPHRSALEGRYDLTGVGVARTPDGTLYVTQLFVLRAAPGTAPSSPIRPPPSG